MAASQLNHVLRRLRKLSDGKSASKLKDRLLLERFVQGQDEAAFEMLLARHGPMVLDVCRRVLHESSAVEDAFQATFLVLARKAGSIRQGELLANWLYGVAYRTAARARVEAAKRNARERAAPSRQLADPLEEMTVRELFAVLDQELNNLPALYRAPLVLCYLENQTRDAAAQQADCSRATLERRLERGKALLKARLSRRGLTLGLALLPTMLPAAPPSSCLAASTLHAATHVAAGGVAASVASASAAALMEGVLRAMFLTKLKITMTVLAGLVLLLAGVSGLTLGLGASAGPAPMSDAAQVAGGKEKKEQPIDTKKPEPNAGKPKPPFAVIAKAKLYEVDDAYYKKLAKSKFSSMEDLEKLEKIFLDPPKEKPPVPPAAASVFDLLEKQKLILAGKEITTIPGKEVALLSWHKEIQCLPGPDQVRKGEKKPQTVEQGVTFLAAMKITPDRRFVSMKLTEKSVEVEAIEKVKVWLDNTNKEAVAEVPILKEAAHSQMRYIPDGGTLLLPIHYRPQSAKDKDRWLVLCITSRIYIEEEEREIQKLQKEKAPEKGG